MWVKVIFLFTQSGHSISPADQQHAAASCLRLCPDCHHGVRPEFLWSFSPTSTQPRDPICCSCHAGGHNKHTTGPLQLQVTELTQWIKCWMVPTGVSSLWDHFQHGLLHCQGCGGASPGKRWSLGDWRPAHAVGWRLWFPGFQSGQLCKHTHTHTGRFERGEGRSSMLQS